MNTELENKPKKKLKPKVAQTMVLPFYSITQLSEIFGMTRLGTRNLLERMNLPHHFIGNKIIFYLSDIQTHQPELFSSILEANQLNALIIPKQTLIDNDYASKESFK